MMTNKWNTSIHRQPAASTGSPDSATDGPSARLSEDQQQLVRNHIGLVAGPLRRSVGRILHPRRHREWEDLFQEGCLGLIQAAMTFDPARGIPFPSYALPRIQHAVSRGVRRCFQTVALPVLRKKPAGAAKPAHETQNAPAIGGPETTLVRDGAAFDEWPDAPLPWPTVQALGDVSLEDDSAQKCHEYGTFDFETVGDRLREKYDRAARRAALHVVRTLPRRRAAHAAIALLLRERLLLPEEESRRPLRQIARESQTSYARVAQCEKRLIEETRRLLLADPEFGELRRRARAHPIGVHAPFDERLARDLRTLSADSYVRSLRCAPPSLRARLLMALEDIAAVGWEDVVRDRVERLPARRRERLFHLARALFDDPSEHPRRGRRRNPMNQRKRRPARTSPTPDRRSAPPSTARSTPVGSTEM